MLSTSHHLVDVLKCFVLTLNSEDNAVNLCCLIDSLKHAEPIQRSRIDGKLVGSFKKMVDVDVQDRSLIVSAAAPNDCIFADVFSF